MSLVDPDTRWHNRGPVRRGAAVACWVMALIAVGVGGWALNRDTGLPTWLVVAVAAVSVPLLAAGSLLRLLGTDSAHFEPRALYVPLAGVGLVFGVCFALSGLPDPVRVGTGTGFATTSLIALAAVELGTRVVERNRRIRARVERSGVTTSGVVTRARRYRTDERDVTRVTVRFTDDTGRDRWARRSLGGKLRTGQRVTVRYASEHLRRRAGVLVTRRRYPLGDRLSSHPGDGSAE